MNLVISVRDNVTEKLEGLGAVATSNETLTAGGRSLRTAMRRQLGTLPPNNRFPGATTGYWQEARESVIQPVVSSPSVTVSITQVGVRYNYFGGTIKAPWKNGSTTNYLTIPAVEEAYGKRASEFSDLTVAWLGRSTSGAPILALVKGLPRTSSRPLTPVTRANTPTTATRKESEATLKPRARLNVMYWLVTSVTKQPNPNVLPSEAVMRVAFASGVREGINSYFGRKAVKLNNLLSLKDLS